MVNLILDLDLTVLSGTPEADESIHEIHSLSEEIPAGLFKIKIINLDKLSELLNSNLYDNIIILTSGAWTPEIRNILADNLKLLPAAEKKLRDCYFHSALTDVPLFNNAFTYDQLRQMPKSVRLTKILLAHPELHGKHVVLDDNPDQVTVLSQMPGVEAIYACTSEPSKGFYQQAHDALALASGYQNNAENTNPRPFPMAPRKGQRGTQFFGTTNEHGTPPAKRARESIAREVLEGEPLAKRLRLQ